MDPIILFFLLDVFAGIVKSPLRLPSQLYDFITLVLLIAIGLKDGVELSKLSFFTLLPQSISIIAVGFV